MAEKDVVQEAAEKQKRKFIEDALMKGVPRGQLELILVIAEVNEEKPEIIMNHWDQQKKLINDVNRSM